MTFRSELAATLAIAAAACAATAGARGAPTQIQVMDVALKVLLALMCVLAGRLTPWPFLATASVVAAAASYGSPAALVAVAAFGVALLGWWEARRARRASGASGADHRATPRGWRLLRVASCGALAGVAVRATWPRVSMGPSLLAGIVVLLLLVPAVAIASRRARLGVLGVAGVLALGTVALTAIAGGAIYEARSPLQAALADARSGLVAAEHGEQSTAVDDFELAAAASRKAQRDLTWARTAEIVPVVSQQVRAIVTAASMGETLAQAGVRTASTASVHDLKLVDGAFPVRRLQALRPVFQEDVNILRSVSLESSAFSSPWIVAPLRSKLSSISSRLRQATHEARIGLLATEQVPGILGADGRRTYLVLVENPAESRASGGIVGDYAEITADAGHLHLVKVGSVAQLNTAGVPPARRTLPPIPDFVDRYGANFPQDHWENVPMSPNFPTVGAVAAYLFPQSGGVKVDGVISVDPFAMAGLLRIVGPVKVPQLAQQVTAANVVSFLANQEFIDFTNNAVRIALLQTLMKVVWHDLTSLPLPAVPTLVQDLAPSVQGGHLLLYSSSPGQESFFRQIHVAGAMAPVHGDFVGVVTQNAAGNKIDWYLRRSISYDATVNLPERTITSTLTIALKNTAPSSGLPPYIIDNFFVAHPIPGENISWVNVYSPWELQSATLDGRPLAMTSQYELGREVYSAHIGIGSGRTDTLQLHFAGAWPRSLSHYELGWYHQPVLFPDTVSSKVTVIR